MAIKKRDSTTNNKILDVLKTEYRWENIVLAILASLALAFSLLIINETLEVREGFPVIGQYPKVFAWVLFGISVVGILLVVYPFIIKALPEVKKISWADWKTSIDAIVKVFIFVILFAFLFLGFDVFIQLVVGKFAKWVVRKNGI